MVVPRAPGMKAVRKVYGFDFPFELESFADFWSKHGPLAECLEVDVVGALAILTGTLAPAKVDPGGDWPRFYYDPPELFTVMVGHTDGLHWGYWFDDPDDPEREPVVADYFHIDSYEISAHASIFEPLRENLEMFHRDAL